MYVEKLCSFVECGGGAESAPPYHINKDVREVELPDEHGKRPNDSRPGAVKDIRLVVVILLDIIVQVLQKQLDIILQLVFFSDDSRCHQI